MIETILHTTAEVIVSLLKLGFFLAWSIFLGGLLVTGFNSLLETSRLKRAGRLHREEAKRKGDELKRIWQHNAKNWCRKAAANRQEHNAKSKRQAKRDDQQRRMRENEAAQREKVREQNDLRNRALERSWAEKVRTTTVTTTVSVRRHIPLATRTKVLSRDRNCVLCGRGPKHGAVIHVDHIKPVSKGGTNELKNLQTLCEECNLGKGDRHNKDWRQSA